ncbi:MAG: radical SAM protein, partial [Candidatus Woesearchaeota archaeon]|nr:radical SAM protein [Candidatus Woesearchaeota archaeon]
MRILLLNLPVHIPTVMPYSITMMKAVLAASLDEEVIALDLNAKYHKKVFKEIYKEKEKDFVKALEKFESSARLDYQTLSKESREGRKVKESDYLIGLIIKKKPDVVGISLTYNSQIYFAQNIIDALNEKGIKTVIGGPGDYSKLKDIQILPTHQKFIEYLKALGAREFSAMKDVVLDYSEYDKEDYFTNEMVYLLRTSISCPYKRCTFCTHHGNQPYSYLELSMIKETIIKNSIKKIYFIDDDFPIPRLKEIAVLMKELKVIWWCQLRPLKGLIQIMPSLYENGLRCVAWGVESGSQKMLDMMDKGTKIEDIAKVLESSKKAGVKNITYVMFGLPGESEKEFMETIEFLEKNTRSIDLVSLSVFGLQKGSRIFENPERFGVKKITLQDRTILGEKIIYEPSTGLMQEEAK